MKEKAIRPTPSLESRGRNRSQSWNDHQGVRTSRSAVSRRNDITFLVANEENVLVAFLPAKGFYFMRS